MLGGIAEMLNKTSVNLGNILLSFSDAIDLANQSISAHQMRAAFIAWQMAKGAKLSQNVGEKIFMGALLHDAGALTTEDKTRLHSFEEINTEIQNWKVKVSPQPNLQNEKKFIIEEGGVFPDRHLGIITIFLTEVEIS